MIRTRWAISITLISILALSGAPAIAGDEGSPHQPAPSSLMGTPFLQELQTVMRNPGSCVRPPAGLTDWWPGDGHGHDLVGRHDARRHGNATFGPGAVDAAFALDGAGDFVDVADSPALDVGTGDFTVDLWVRFNDTSREQILVEKWVQIFDGPSQGWTFTKLEDNSVGFFGEDGLGGGNGTASAPLDISANAWIHFAARRSGSTVEILMNGVVVASNPSPDVADLSSASSLKFGHRGSPRDTPGSQDESGFFLNGRIDEVEFVVGRALSSREILNIYLAGAAGKCKEPPTPPSCVTPPAGLAGWWPGDGSGADIAGGRDAALRGNATFGRGLVGQSFVLDGDGDFVDVAHDLALDLGVGDFTVDLWVRFADTTGEQVLVEKYVERFGEESTGWSFSKVDGVFFSGTQSSLPGIPANVWLHFAARRRGPEISVFMNGVQVAFAQVDASTNFDTTSSLKFGHRGGPDDTPGSLDDRGFFLNGRIDEVELLVGRALSDEEIRSIYFAGASGKCK